MRLSFLSLVGLSFSVAAGLGYLSSSCAPLSDCDDGGPEPEPVGPLPIEEARMSDAEAALPVDPVGGTLTIERERVIVSYDSGGKQHQIVYAVVGKP